MEKKYQVFISSTYKDLIPERQKVRDVILSMYHFPIGMEMFSAADEEQWEIIQETIDSSDYYVLIIGKRYGSIIPEGKPDAGMSYTEKEYRYAVSRGVPVLTFIKKDSAVSSDNIDMEPAAVAKLNAFVGEITGARETAWFGSVDELGTEVSLALHKQMDRKKRPGWIRGDRIDVDASLNELVALNQKVRELENENKRLRETIMPREPVLNVSMQFAGTIEAPLVIEPEDVSEADDTDLELCISEIIQRKDVARKGYLGLEESLRLDLEDVPDEVKGLVSQADLDDYNSKLPDDETIEKYDSDMQFYNEVQRNGQLINFLISNDGTAKATDLNVTLVFPSSFVVLKRTKAESFLRPKAPQMPANPIEQAMAQQVLGQNAILQAIQAMNKSFQRMDFLDEKPLGVSAALLDGDLISDRSVKIEGNVVKIWSKDLLHTYSDIIDGLCVIPMEKGTFKIKVVIICEEYSHPSESELEIIVQ